MIKQTKEIYFSYSAYNYTLLPSPRYGLNSGIMIMDLERMRKTHWTDKIRAAADTLLRHTTYFDQVIFHIVLTIPTMLINCPFDDICRLPKLFFLCSD